jgi:hypothetical protein
MAGTGSALERLIDYHRGVLSGADAPTSLAGLEGLATLCWDDAGWLPDRLMRTRDFLDGLLSCWAATSSYRPYRGVTRGLIMQAVAKRWGVSCFPHSAPEVVAAMGLQVDGRTVNEWAVSVTRDPATHSYVDTVRLIRPSRPPDSGKHTLWPRVINELWPEGTGHKQLLVERARASIGDVLHGSTSRDDPRVHPLRRRADESSRLLRLLRILTARRASEWFGDGLPGPAYTHWRQLTFDVIAPWASAEEFALQAPVLLGGPLPTGSRYRRSVAAAVQMLMFAVAEDRRALCEQLDADEFRRRHLATLITKVGCNGADALNDPVKLLRLGSLRDTAGPRLLVASAASSPAALLPSGPLTAAQLKDLADDIRRQPPDVKRAQIRRYLQARPDAIAAAGTVLERQWIALADQGVGFDCIVAEDESLVTEFARQRLKYPAGERYGYLAHAQRDLAVTHNKHNRFGAGDHLVLLGERDITKMVDDKLIVERREGLESGHQLWLSAAGLKVRRLEHTLAPHYRLQAASTARDALRYSALAWNTYRILDGDYNLRAPRHQDGFISTAAWEFQSRLIRLRVLLAVRLALDIKVFKPEDVERPSSALIGHVGIGVVPAPQDWLVEVGIDHLKQLYRELLKVPGQHTRDPIEFVRVALTLAFRCGGALPVVQAEGGILARARFLDAAPDGIAGEFAETRVDIASAVLWLASRKSDAGVVSWYRSSSRLYRLLQQTSSGAFDQFRRDEQRPAVPSHD